MVALRRFLVLALVVAPAAILASKVLPHSGSFNPIVAEAAPIDASLVGESVSAEAILSPQFAVQAPPRTPAARVGLFRIPVLSPVDLAVGPLAVLPTRASLQVDPDDDATTSFIETMTSDPIHDAMKPGMQAWPSVDRSGKGDRASLPTAAGVGPDKRLALVEPDPMLPADGVKPLTLMTDRLAAPGDAVPLSRFEAPLVGDAVAYALARRLQLAEIPPQSGGTVPLDRTGAPIGGTTPAAAHPSLADLDTRTTTPSETQPVEMAATAVETPPPVIAEAPLPPPKIVMASVYPTPESERLAPGEIPPTSPDEGFTEAMKVMPGLDDGIARPLNLPPVLYTRSQKCLATAIYFEARSESEEGQIAVAQVVINRVRSIYYPNNVCDVVYQGASMTHYGGCQFSFNCDGIRHVVDDRDSWDKAMVIAQKVLDGEDWLPAVGNATHYHAEYVHPRWVRDMVEKDKIGRHIFYRVRWWT